MVKGSSVALAVFLFLFIGNAWAHHPIGAAGIGQAGPVKTISASTLPKGKLALELQAEFIDFDSFSDDELKKFAEAGEDVHSVDSVFHSVLGLGYGLTDDFTLSLRISYESLKGIRETHHEEPEDIHDRGDSKGIGDLAIMGQYRFLKRNEEAFESSLLFGIKVPTGKTTRNDKDGERLEAELQPGTGSWNPMLGIAATKRSGRLSIDANLLYTFMTKGAQNTELGDIFNYNASFSYRMFRDTQISWDLIVEANGEWKQKQKIAGVRDPNSGQHILFLSPGMRLIWNKRWSAYVSAGVPVMQDLNGIQNETNFRAMAGISLVF